MDNYGLIIKRQGKERMMQEKEWKTWTKPLQAQCENCKLSQYFCEKCKTRRMLQMLEDIPFYQWHNLEENPQDMPEAEKDLDILIQVERKPFPYSFVLHGWYEDGLRWQDKDGYDIHFIPEGWYECSYLPFQTDMVLPHLSRIPVEEGAVKILCWRYIEMPTKKG